MMTAVSTKTPMVHEFKAKPGKICTVSETERRNGKSFCSAPHFQPASPISSISAPRVKISRPRTVGSLAGRKMQISMAMPSKMAKMSVTGKAI